MLLCFPLLSVCACILSFSLSSRVCSYAHMHVVCIACDCVCLHLCLCIYPQYNVPIHICLSVSTHLWGGLHSCALVTTTEHINILHHLVHFHSPMDMHTQRGQSVAVYTHGPVCGCTLKGVSLWLHTQRGESVAAYTKKPVCGCTHKRPSLWLHTHMGQVCGCIHKGASLWLHTQVRVRGESVPAHTKGWIYLPFLGHHPSASWCWWWSGLQWHPSATSLTSAVTPISFYSTSSHLNRSIQHCSEVLHYK